MGITLTCESGTRNYQNLHRYRIPRKPEAKTAHASLKKQSKKPHPDHISRVVRSQSCTSLDIDTAFPRKSHYVLRLSVSLPIISNANFHTHPKFIT